jgi:hypothetical protein
MLEEEKDAMARRLGDSVPPRDEQYFRPPADRPTSPDRGPVEGDIRVASLESANRRLQEELRVVSEDNDRLRDELEQWKNWELENRDERVSQWQKSISLTVTDSTRSLFGSARLCADGTSCHRLLPE